MMIPDSKNLHGPMSDHCCGPAIMRIRLFTYPISNSEAIESDPSARLSWCLTDSRSTHANADLRLKGLVPCSDD
jgi:hypothetical protein